MSDWIKCTERRPELGDTVICWNECALCRGKVEHAHTCIATGYPRHGAFTCALLEINGLIRWNAPYSPNVTHWMPLPKAPNE